MAQVLYCLASALIAGLLVFMVMAVRLKNQKNQADREVARYKQMLKDGTGKRGCQQTQEGK